MIGWFIGGAMNLAGPIQYLVLIGWSISICLEWIFLLTGFGAIEFGVELAGLLEDPTASVGMISWFIGVAVNLAGSIQYPV